MSTHSGKIKTWLLLAVVVSVGSTTVTAIVYWKPREVVQTLLYHRPVDLSVSFQTVVKDADRLVVREGGYGCHGIIDDDPVLAVITDKMQLERVASHLHFGPSRITNSVDLGECQCCGYPGLDWYRGTKRVALTSVHHGKRLRWKGFSTLRLLGITVGYGDAPLTTESQEWLAAWLKEHGASEEQRETDQ